MSVAGADNNYANSNNVIFTIKDTKLYVPVVTLSRKDSHKLSKLLSKGSKRYWNCIGMNIKQKVRDGTYQYRSFLESNFLRIYRLFVLAHSYRNNDVKRHKVRRHYLRNGTIFKIFYDQPIDSDIKRFKEIRKLKIGQDED